MENPLSIKLHKLLLSEFSNSSQSLAKFARKKDYSKNDYRILRDENGTLYIGIRDRSWIHGSKLISVASGDFNAWAFPRIESCEDVTEWFIREYKEKGMCAYTDMRHEWDVKIPDEDLGAGSTRMCIHCGKREMMKATMVRKTWWEELKL